MAAGPSTPFPSSGRPELEEFLTALNGFLNHEPSVSDPTGYFKFLGIFCRSIGASEGHMLIPAEGGGLKSELSFGLKKDFGSEYNRGRESHADEDTPLETAFKEQDVVAVVDVAKDPEIPEWFSTLLDKNDFRSLVAVPLVGPGGPKGILCAYYHDVCLFDQGTLNHLAMIGKMVGAATDKDSKAGAADGAIEAVDAFLTNLSQGNTNFFSHLASAVVLGCHATGAVCGPVKKSSAGLSLSIEGAHGLKGKPAGGSFLIPAILQKPLMSGRGVDRSYPVPEGEWGSLKKSMNPPGSHASVFPIAIHKKVFGAVLVWRLGGGFTSLQIQAGLRLALLAAAVLSGPPNK